MGTKTDKSLPYYRQDTKAVLAELHTTREGLPADMRAKRLEEFGPNRLQELHRESLPHKYFRQFKDLMILLLIGCSLLSFATKDKETGVVLLALVLFNTVIGFSQEFKAEKLMESLEKLVVNSAKVLRDGQLVEVPASDLVPGDIVYIEEGDSVPADLRVIEESELSSNDFALTGESSPARKFTHAIQSEVVLGNRHNLCFMGTTVATGHAYGVVVGSGMRTELGRIASLSEETEQDVSPLQRELNHIAKRVTQGTIVLCAILLPVAMKLGNLPFHNALLFAIGIASSIIPQGLPAEINTALAQAANKLAKARALVKKLSAVESLGATSIILTDKTGTLTKNEMTVQQVYIGGQTYDISGTGYQPEGQVLLHKKALSAAATKDLELFFSCGTLASNAHIKPADSDHPDWYCIGDPTEGALVTLARKAGLDPNAMDESMPELREFAFDSARKRMTSIRQYGAKKQAYAFVKGAPENVLERCTEIWINGHIRKLTVSDHAAILKQHNAWANGAMRNLAFAFKILPDGTKVKGLKMDQVEQGLVFMGLVSMMDPLRDEVPEAMKAAHAAHIKVSIITGDFAPTAKAIALRAGLAAKHQEITVVTGDELKNLDDSRVLQLVNKGSVIFSRVAPEDKLRIVGLVKESGKVVAVTGDGINDAPALKRADIGVAMGRTGTDVAKQSAEIVLLDDSFKTLVGAVQQGRVIFQNIKKGTLSCFTSNGAELVINLVSLFALSLFHVPLALSVMQILAIDMIIELFPIASLGWDLADSDVMTEKPRNPAQHILNKLSVIDLLWCGLLIGGLAFGNFILFFWRNHVPASHIDQLSPELYLRGTALAFLTIVFCQLLNILQRRSHHGLFTRYQFNNKQLAIALAFSLFCVANIIYNPVIAPYFGTGPLELKDWCFAIGAALLFIGIRELQRYANTHHTRDHVLKLYAETFGSPAPTK